MDDHEMIKKRGPGRPPKGEYSGKSAALMTRITPQLHAALKKAAEDNGRSLSQEAERRLRNSFDRTMQQDYRAQLASRFGGDEMLAAVLLLAHIVAALEGMVGARWHENAYTAARVGDAARLMFRELAPPGDPDAVPDQIEEMRRRIEPHQIDPVAAVVMGALEQLKMSADETALPVQNEDGSWTHTATTMQRMAFIRQTLGRSGCALPEPAV